MCWFGWCMNEWIMIFKIGVSIITQGFSCLEDQYFWQGSQWNGLDNNNQCVDLDDTWMNELYFSK